MSIRKSASLLGLAVMSAMLFAVTAQAGTIEVAPGATTLIDVADRGGYTTIIVANAAGTAGSVTIDGQTVAVPANGKIEVYGRYGRGAPSASYAPVTNTGSVPLRLTSRYQQSYPAQ